MPAAGVASAQASAEANALERLLAGLERIAPLCAAEAAQAERRGRLSEPVARALRELGLYRLWIPQSCAGLELSLPAALTVYQAAAALEGAVGWATMIGTGGGLFAAYLALPIAREIFGAPAALIAGSGAPGGRAERIPGGYRVTGQWRYASGASEATTFTANCMVMQNGEPLRDANGAVLIRAMAFTREQVRLRGNWHASGMAATDSQDFEVEQAQVPEERSFSVFTDAPREPGPLYRLPFEVLTELPVIAVALGIARHALAEFAQLARERRASAAAAGLAGAEALIAERFAEAHAQVALADAGITALAQEAWAAALAARVLEPHARAAITAGCTTTMMQLRRVIAELMALSGMSAIREDHPLARAWRDLQAVAAHVSLSPAHLPAAGRALLGTRERR